MRTIALFLICLGAHFLFSQEDFYASQSRFMQKTNPSYFGVNNSNKIGILYNTIAIDQNNSSDNKYVFGVVSFDEKKFSLGFDINSLKVASTELEINSFKVTYVYKIRANNTTYFLPGISLAIGNYQINKQDLIFEDQLNATTGFINTETIDPLGSLLGNATYFDLGASLLIHSQKHLFGFSLRHLNRPNTSLNREKEYNKPVSISVQGGIEFDVNPYERSFLPRHSFLFTYAAITQIEKKMFVDLVQEMRMAGFSVGLNQKLSNSGGFNFNSIGLGAGLRGESFEFGMTYNFPFRAQAKIHSPSIFEIFVTFDFGKYRRNQRGFFKHLQTGNY